MSIDFNEVKAQAQGKWLSIWRALGIDVDETGRHGPCPSCSPGVKTSDRFRVDRNVAEKGSFYCNGCGPGFGPDLVMRVLGIDIKEAMEAIAKVVGNCERTSVAKEKSVSPEFLRKIFEDSTPIRKGDVGYTYLQNRGLSKIPQMLRYSKVCWNPDTKKPEHAILAVFTMPCNKAITMHRIFLTADSDKLPVDEPKKLLPALGKLNTGAVRLWPAQDTLGVAEGIETAIAASEIFDIPVWASLNATLLESFEPPKNINKLVVFGDNDANYTGHKSAYLLANRVAMQRKIAVQVEIPSVTGRDWLDVLNLK